MKINAENMRKLVDETKEDEQKRLEAEAAAIWDKAKKQAKEELPRLIKNLEPKIKEAALNKDTTICAYRCLQEDRYGLVVISLLKDWAESGGFKAKTEFFEEKDYDEGPLEHKAALIISW